MANRTYVPYVPADPKRERIFKYFEDLCGKSDLRTTLMLRYWHTDAVDLRSSHV